MTLGDPPPSDNRKTPLEHFASRCETRAILWQLGYLGDADDPRALQNAVDELEGVRQFYGIDPDTAQLIMARAFAAVRDDLGGWRP